MQAAQKLAERKAAADEAKEEKHRQWMVDQLQHDRQLRKDEFEHQRLIRADERDAERAERNDERAHQLEIMTLQVQLAQAQAKTQGSSLNVTLYYLADASRCWCHRRTHFRLKAPEEIARHPSMFVGCLW